MSSLPAELWRNIILLAVNEPTSLFKTWDARDWDPPAPEGVRMKLVISRVCRLWHAIGTELLYTHLHFPRSTYDDIEHVATLFEQQRDKLGSAYGHATKRIDVRVECISSRLDVQPLLRLLKFVSNLVVLVFLPYPPGTFVNEMSTRFIPVFEPPAVAQLSRILEQRFKHSFLCLSLDISLSSLDGAALPELPLQMLDLATTLCSPNPHPCTATVRSLTLNLLQWPVEDPLYWHFPCLDELTLISMGRRDISRLGPFLALNGPLITSLNIIPYRIQPTEIDGIAPILNACPCLQKLAIPSRLVYTSTPNIKIASREFPRVQTVVIHPIRAWWESPIILFITSSLFPGVKIIRHGIAEKDVDARGVYLLRKLRLKGVKLDPELAVDLIQELDYEDMKGPDYGDMEGPDYGDIMADYSAKLFAETDDN